MSGSPERLVIRAKPFDDESYTGFLIRLAEANRYPTSRYVSELAKDMRGLGALSHSSRAAEATRLRTIERNIGLQPREISDRWPQISRGTSDALIRIGGLQAAVADLRPGATQICPDCVVENGYCRTIWELRAYTGCPRHRRLLLTHCAHCQAPLSPGRGRLLTCGRCDMPLDVESETLAEEDLKWERWLEKWTKSLAPNETVINRTNEIAHPLNSFAPQENLEIVRTMAWLLYGRKNPWLINLREPACSRHKQLVAVLGAFERWPHRWHSLLEARARREAGRAPRATFSRELKLLDDESAVLRPLADAFFEWYERKHHTMRKRIAVGMSAKSAAQLLAKSEGTIKRWVQHGRLDGVTNADQIPLAAVEAAKIADKTYLALTSARKVLKIGYRTLRDLMDDGIIKTEQHPLSGRRCVSTEAIHRLFGRLSVLQAARRSTGTGYTLTKALAMLGPEQISISKLVALVLDEKIRLTTFDERNGLRSMQFSGDDLRRYCNRHTSDDQVHMVTLPEAARYLNVIQYRITQLLTWRVLSLVRVKSGSGRVRRLIRFADLRAFNEQYVTLGEIAGRCGRDEKDVERRFSWADMQPATLGSGSFSHEFYERDSAETYMRARLAQNQARSDI